MNGTYRMDPVVAAAAPEILTLTLPPAALVAVTTEAAVMWRWFELGRRFNERLRRQLRWRFDCHHLYARGLLHGAARRMLLFEGFKIKFTNGKLYFSSNRNKRRPTHIIIWRFSFYTNAAIRAASFSNWRLDMPKNGSKRRAWTSVQVRELKTMARRKTPAGRIAQKLKRTEGATRQKAFSIGLSLDSR